MTCVTGCAGRMATVSAFVAVPGTDLQLGGHQPPAARGEQALPDDGAHVAQDHEACQREPAGDLPVP